MCTEDLTYRKYGGKEETSWWKYRQLAQGQIPDTVRPLFCVLVSLALPLIQGTE